MTRLRSTLAVLALTSLVVLLLAAVPARAGGDPVRGEDVYGRCAGCHSIDRNRAGPKHRGLFGRKAGSVPGFRYSKDMRDSDVVWTEETLDRFLRAPRKMFPKTRMGYAGVKDDQDRADLIAYLRQATRPQ